MRLSLIITLLGLLSPILMATSDTPSDEEALTNLADVLEGYRRVNFVPTTLVPALEAFIAPSTSMGYDQFEDPLKWYRPTPDELTFLTSLNFRPEHLGAALRFRKFITSENAALFQRVLGDSSWEWSQNLMPAALGLSQDVLEEATLLPASQDRFNFLKNAPREDAWVYGMLGSDSAINHILEGHVKKRMEENPEYVSAFFIRNLKDGSDITRMRLTGFLQGLILEGGYPSMSRFTSLGYSSESHVVRALKKHQLSPPFFRRLRKPFEPSAQMISIEYKYPHACASMPTWAYTPSPYLRPIM